MAEIQASYKIDTLINNAGILIDDDFDKINHQKLDQVMMVNTFAPLEMIRLVLPQMRDSQFGRIINMSSGLGSFDSGLTGPFSYSLSKASLNALTLTISQSLPENVTINAMCPGWVRTDMGGKSADRSPDKGAETAIWLTEQDNGVNGRFFRDKKEISW
jgi:NAD(P)-dependent dehydrogenase (short-subunit alcohol dehydrogenase family)